MNLKEIKDAARKAFRDQQLQDTEGGVPDAVSFIAGFLAGVRQEQENNSPNEALIKMLQDTIDAEKERSKILVEALEYIQANTESSYIFHWTEEALNKYRNN